MKYYLQTNREGTYVEVPSDPQEEIKIVEGIYIPPYQFNLVNTLTHRTMREVRELVKSAGLRLRNPKRIAVRL